jgi:hypothetical protein
MIGRTCLSRSCPYVHCAHAGAPSPTYMYMQVGDGEFRASAAASMNRSATRQTPLGGVRTVGIPLPRSVSEGGWICDSRGYEAGSTLTASASV